MQMLFSVHMNGKQPTIALIFFCPCGCKITTIALLLFYILCSQKVTVCGHFGPKDRTDQKYLYVMCLSLKSSLLQMFPFKDVKFVFPKIWTSFVKFEFLFKFVLLYHHIRLMLGLYFPTVAGWMQQDRNRPSVAVSRRQPWLVFDTQFGLYTLCLKKRAHL